MMIRPRTITIKMFTIFTTFKNGRAVARPIPFMYRKMMKMMKVMKVGKVREGDIRNIIFRATPSHRVRGA